MRLTFIVALVACANVAHAQSDPCAWLTPTQLAKELGGTFQPAQKHEAIPAYRGQNPGTQCVFSGPHSVILIVYVDKSPAEAKSTFESMMGSFYKVDSKPSGLGDEAYFDTRRGLHILKGKTRLFIDTGVSDPTKAHQNATDLAQLVLPNA